MTTPPFVLGLTGSIAMGKTTTAELFRERGIPIWDADDAVHRLYSKGGKAVEAVAALVPDAVGEDGVDRSVLRAALLEDPTLLQKLEALVHPLVAEDRAGFLDDHGGDIVLCDVPLLYETGGDAWCDRVVVVSASAEVQRGRALARPGMTEAAFDAILGRQVPDAKKRARADYVIDTGQGIEAAAAQVDDVLADIERIRHA